MGKLILLACLVGVALAGKAYVCCDFYNEGSSNKDGTACGYAVEGECNQLHKTHCDIVSFSLQNNILYFYADESCNNHHVGYYEGDYKGHHCVQQKYSSTCYFTTPSS